MKQILFFLCVLLMSCDKEELKSARSANLGLKADSKGDWQLDVWSPTAHAIELKLYDGYDAREPSFVRGFVAGFDSVWRVEIPKDWSKHYYTVQMRDKEGRVYQEVTDPYVKMVGVNGKRGYIDLPSNHDPEGWVEDRYVETNVSDAIIYELQIRDFSIDSSGQFRFPGKFLAFTEKGKKIDGQSIGIDHLSELGITHVHLLPAFDFRSLDEAKIDVPQYNWGYDPLNYNVPEGTFSTDPFDPASRIVEFKRMVQALHQAGLGVIMDVVYNHTGPTEESNFNQLVPEYYYRMDKPGMFSNASACGNETASEQPMMRKFIIESMVYWMQEYHVDGFRVDLMGIHDIETMNQVKSRLKEINPDVLLYGEGWAAGSSPLSEDKRALKNNASLLDDIAVFGDEMRDGLKGHWNDHKDKGFITGKSGTKESVKFGIVGAIQHPQVDYTLVNYSDTHWADHPLQAVNYVTCHDGMTLFDRISNTSVSSNLDEKVAMHQLANTVVMTSQGIPFLHGGVDFLRSKLGEHNSYKSSDEINSIKWDLKTRYREVHSYYQELINLRKNHLAFTIGDADLVRENLQFLEVEDSLIIAYTLNGQAVGDTWDKILVIFNGNLSDRSLRIPDGEWNQYLSSGKFIKNGSVISDQISLASSSATILYQ